MAELTLKFNLPEDSEEAKITLAAGDMHCAIWGFKQDLRSKLKHGEYKDEVYEMLDEISELFHQHLIDHNVIKLF
jgi:hypothetical protein